MANTPNGVRDTTNFVALPTASFATLSASISAAFPDTPMSAIPTTTLNSTTAGTTLLASELNGLAGMYRLTRSNDSRGSTSVVLKKDAFSSGGNMIGKRKTAPSATAQSSTSTTPTR